ncbi:methyltransferase family protein [Mucilaginibacter sp. OK098]|uniref:methyltransferase family protein n=1 Tax=Mucilaginibacter sp. OK098 TaxID=1855297 RepID=UPI001F33E23F|nr:isoprenylcysteine carboxylmethyltransferase family protein [Mucilaginibacter sp. OK098]
MGIIFGVSELLLLILKRSKKSGVKASNDGRSLPFLWIIITACIIIGPLITKRQALGAINSTITLPAGIIIVIAGFITRWITIIQLGSMFTVDVAISNSHVLKTNGMYKLVRHPSYLGLMLIIAGLAVLLNNWLSFIIIVIPISIVLNYRMLVEEKALTGEFGDQYLSYMQKVKRIIPFIY